MKVKLNEKQKLQLERAIKEIKLASALVDTVSMHIKPFRISKALNMMMKTLETDRQVLTTILEGESTEWLNEETYIPTPASKLLKRQIDDEE